MRILISPDSFKGSLSAIEAAEAIAEGWRRARPEDELVELPIADGGEGTVETIIRNVHGKMHEARVCGPLAGDVKAIWGTMNGGKTAVVEMAAASGILLIPKNRLNPLKTTTFGTGEILREALEHGCEEILIGIGGSATTDAGLGMAQALGYRFFRGDGSEIESPAAGEHLNDLARIDFEDALPKLREVTIRVACDVKNPLYGKDGAAYVYGPQKGADEQKIERLDAGLRRFAEVAKKDLEIDVTNLEGAGAAGGLGAGLVAFCGAKLVSGIDTILETVGFEEKMKGCDFVISGEGKLDLQTVQGKAIAGILKKTKPARIPVVIFAGVIDVDEQDYRDEGMREAISFAKYARDAEDSIENAAKYLAQAAEDFAKTI